MKKIFLIIIWGLLINNVFSTTTSYVENGINYGLSPETSSAQVLAYNQSYIGDIIIPSTFTLGADTYSVTSIGDFAFGYCTGLTSISIPSTVTSIGSYAFSNCTRLNNITIPITVKSIGDYAFTGCSAFTSISFPSSVTSIGEGVFDGCTGLNSITIPSTLVSIGGHAFYNCSGITSITIPSTQTSIGEETFCFCSGITSITIPSSVSSIGKRAFYGCWGLNSINIPSIVTSIGDFAFGGCSAFSEINVNSIIPPTLGSDVFDLIDKSKCKLKVPMGTLSAYKSANQWKDFLNIEEMLTTKLPFSINNSIKIYKSDDKLVIVGSIKGETITVYDIYGVQIQNVISQGENLNISVDRAAVYLVKMGEKTFKVIL